MTDPIAIVRNGHRTWLKWHRARRRGTDPVFTGGRILEGMRMGASVEIDLVVHGEHGFAVLHDMQLGRESTGSGRVSELSAAALRGEYIRDNSGRPTTEPVRLLEDITALLASGGVHPDALLQLDYKEDNPPLAHETLENFARVVAPVARHMIVSSGDAGAVTLLTGAAPGIRVGYDPCHGDALTRLSRDGDYARFVDEAVDASPRAEMIYLAHPVVTGADAAGFDIVSAFHAAGRRVDAYTIRRADAETLPIVTRLLELQVDQITTDDPEGLADAVAGR